MGLDRNAELSEIGLGLCEVSTKAQFNRYIGLRWFTRTRSDLTMYSVISIYVVQENNLLTGDTQRDASISMW